MRHFLTLALLFSALFSATPSVKSIQALPIFNRNDIKVIDIYDHGTVYELELEITTLRGMQVSNAFLTKDKKTLFFGEAYNVQTKQPIKRPLNLTKMQESADFKVGNGKKHYFVFTDPECHYCKVFERMWPKLHKDVTLYIYLMPLAQHRNATAMSHAVMMQKSDFQKASLLISIAQGSNQYASITPTPQMQTLFNQKLAKNKALSQKLGVRGTPTVFDTNLQQVNWQNLAQ